jgi:hypothetical protein
MPLPPGSSSFPPSIPHSLRRSVYVDVPNVAATGSVRWGPYSASIIPILGGQQVEREGTVTLASDRVYLPPYAQCSAGTIITDVLTGKSYEAQFVQQWPSTIEVLVKREGASL